MSFSVVLATMNMGTAPLFSHRHTTKWRLNLMGGNEINLASIQHKLLDKFVVKH